MTDDRSEARQRVLDSLSDRHAEIRLTMGRAIFGYGPEQALAWLGAVRVMTLWAIP